MATNKRVSVGMVGAGFAAASVGRALGLAGHAVHMFDKSRRPGGRLATPRVEWVDRQWHAATTRLDHGALGLTASGAAFRTFVDLALQAGLLAEWKAKLAAGNVPLEGGAMLHVPVPDMPALCRHLFKGVPAGWSFAVDRLHRALPGWQVQAGGVRHVMPFDVAVVALPPRRPRHCSTRTGSTGPVTRPSPLCSRGGH